MPKIDSKHNYPKQPPNTILANQAKNPRPPTLTSKFGLLFSPIKFSMASSSSVSDNCFPNDFSFSVEKTRVDNSNFMIPYFHQQQFPLHNSSPHSEPIASMMARHKQAAAAISFTPVGPIPGRGDAALSATSATNSDSTISFLPPSTIDDRPPLTKNTKKKTIKPIATGFSTKSFIPREWSDEKDLQVRVTYSAPNNDRDWQANMYTSSIRGNKLSVVKKDCD
ncbi:hypothetical protein RND71_034609 [Anisodus tanguticus]|uniref:Uncharacterized protein n=1 Tax=Anisodus tanguticus TaxID=243964 RepID=A0AAE1RAX2_9SOLA|nr:hypothetical protein RND71_034609 [Anisodus tanguticus]